MIFFFLMGRWIKKKKGGGGGSVGREQEKRISYCMAESQDYKEEMPDWTEAWSVLIRVQEDTVLVLLPAKTVSDPSILNHLSKKYNVCF